MLLQRKDVLDSFCSYPQVTVRVCYVKSALYHKCCLIAGMEWIILHVEAWKHIEQLDIFHESRHCTNDPKQQNAFSAVKIFSEVVNKTDCLNICFTKGKYNVSLFSSFFNDITNVMCNLLMFCNSLPLAQTLGHGTCNATKELKSIN